MSPLNDILRSWHDFYILIGTASATLVGLTFVTASIGAAIFRERPHGLRAFLSPTVVHFSTVLIACLIALVPAESPTSLGLLLAGGGLLGLLYGGFVWRAMIRHGMNIDLEDRLWYAMLPILGHLLLAMGGLGLVLQAPMGCDLLAVGMGLLLIAGIRNAWDMTVWIIGRQAP
ncbi:MAG: hypothetical protein JOY71_01280 [Acetobacteraceae bacterium]|nr:hypothetical protein [Acetobacteraceae bacterium]MBV8520760.1 hypothetical protein [Acetobacteraceae bacterium]